MKKLLLAIMLTVGVQAHANISDAIGVTLFPYAEFQQTIMSEVGTYGLPWKTGESASYSVDMGFIKGTSVMSVREETSVGFWLIQDMDLGFMGKQKAEVLVDKKTGQILELIVNGQKQQPPEPGQSEVEETRQDKVSVPAGSFDCIYARIKDISKNQTSEVWVNPSIVPISGMIKQIAPGPMGKVKMELTSFDKK
ncbi:MAG: hypothetical protein KDD35_00415 [Bdellovibrionales bacterium]|nr:hypothetical protein [Bdellovibrionales bacterium]